MAKASGVITVDCHRGTNCNFAHVPIATVKKSTALESLELCKAAFVTADVKAALKIYIEANAHD